MFAPPHFLEHVFLRKYMMFIDHTSFHVLTLAWGTWTTTWFALTMFCLSFVMFSTMLWTSIGGLNPSIIDLPSSACVHKSIDPNGCQTFAMCSHQTNKDRSCGADAFSSIACDGSTLSTYPKYENNYTHFFQPHSQLLSLANWYHPLQYSQCCHSWIDTNILIPWSCLAWGLGNKSDATQNKWMKFRKGMELLWLTPNK